MLSLSELIDVLDDSFPERLADTKEEKKALSRGFSLNCVRIDSREITQNDLFVCLPGDRVDGHAYLSEAFSKGAAAALIEETYALKPTDPKELLYLRVPETLGALQLLAKHIVDKEQPEIIAITGAMGKTTTRNFLFRILDGLSLNQEAHSSEELAFAADTSEEFSLDQLGEKLQPSLEVTTGSKEKVATAFTGGIRSTAFVAQPSRNFNSQAGLPVSILNELSGAKCWVLEMAMTHPGDIKSLVHMAPPTYSILTTMPEKIEDYIHAAEFEVIEEAVQAKCEIFESEKLRRAFIPDDLPNLEAVVSNIYAEKTVFSFSDAMAAYSCFLTEDGKTVELFERGECKLRLPLYFPKHHLRNYFIPFVVARELGASWEELEKKKMDFSLPKMRFERIEKGGVVLYSDAYNGSPIAMRLAIDSLEKGNGRRIAILGEILGLGPHTQKGHISAMQHALLNLDKVFFYGNNWNAAAHELNEPAQIYEDHAALSSAVVSELQPGDVLYVKGSRLCELERPVEEILSKL